MESKIKVQLEEEMLQLAMDAGLSEDEAEIMVQEYGVDDYE